MKTPIANDPRSRWRTQKRYWWALAVLLPIALLWGIKQMASWRPRRLALGKFGASPYFMAGRGNVQVISNTCIFLVYASDDSPIHEEAKSLFCVLDPDGHVRQSSVPVPRSSSNDRVVVHFLSDTKAVIWNTTWDWKNPKYRGQLEGQIFDFQNMRSLRKLQSVPLREGEMGFGNEPIYGTTRNGAVVLVGQFEALQWNLESGKLLRLWNLHKPDDDENLTQTTYSPRTDSFVQAMAGRIRVWNAKTGRLMRTSAQTLPHFKLDYGEGESASSVEFSPDANLLAYDSILASGRTGPLLIARSDTGQTLWQIQNSHDVGHVQFAPDGREVYFHSRKERRFTVCDARTGRVLRYLQAPAEVDQFWISPDGTHLCSSNLGEIWWQRIR